MFWEEMISSRHIIAGNGTYPTFEEMVFLEGTTQINERWAAVDRSIYAKHLKHWLRIFPRKTRKYKRRVQSDTCDLLKYCGDAKLVVE